MVTDLVEVVIFLRLEKMEGLPFFFTRSSQQVVEHVVVPTDTHRRREFIHLFI